MKILLILFATLFLSSCSYSYPKDGSLQLSRGLDTSRISFSDVQSVIFNPVCSRCHGAELIGNYSAVKSNLPEISRRLQLQGGDVMPPSGQIPSANLQLFLAWMKNGAPEFASAASSSPSPAPTPEENKNPPADSAPKPPTTPSEFTFAEVKEKVFQPKCAACHAGMMKSYDSVKSHLANIDARISKGQMPPSGMEQLSEEEKSLVLRWIAAGAPEI